MNPSTALATVLLDALAAGGVRHLVLCPGSRSAPLAYAARAAEVAGRIALHVRVDERSAGFLALGLARAAGGPVVVVTTSGTAVANLHPAVLEASHAEAPLVVVSADRPHELRGTGANQTTDQLRLFGSAVRMFAELPAADRRPGQVVGWRNVVARLLAAATGRPAGDPGPVHLNVALVEPLVPDLGGPDGEDGWPEPLTGTAGLTSVAARRSSAGIALPAGPRTVLLAGDGAGPAARAVAEGLGWPLLAEPSSGARSGPNAVGPYRLLLGHPRLGAAIERVVVCGRPTLSRPVSALLARVDVEVVVVSGRTRWPDPGLRAALVVPGLPAPLNLAPTDAWLHEWLAAGGAAADRIDAVLDEEAAAGRLTGPLVAREVAAATGPGQALVAGSSNPIRDLDLAGRPFDAGLPPEVLATRGLSGIDGTLSFASGVALWRADSGGALPVRALIGDLTFLHDAGGLLVGALERSPDLQAVVVDDAGGGIFGLLEQGELAARDTVGAATFERLFGTPQAADLAALCSGYGTAYSRVRALDELRKALADPPPGRSVVHVRVDRSGERALAARLRAVALDPPER